MEGSSEMTAGGSWAINAEYPEATAVGTIMEPLPQLIVATAVWVATGAAVGAWICPWKSNQ